MDETKAQTLQPPQEITPTITNIYGREQRNERVKQKTQKMNTLLVNAIQINKYNNK